MSKFERIIREPLVMGGQARIRDTGITVNEIVRLSLEGSSQAEILQAFPQLEAEDVHQALGYVVEHTSLMQVNSLQELLPEINGLKGWSNILRQSLSEPQIQIDPEKAINLIQQMIAMLDYKSIYYELRARLLYSWYQKQDSKLILLIELEKEIQSYLPPNFGYLPLNLDENLQDKAINTEFIPIIAFLTQQKQQADLSIIEMDGKTNLKISVPEFAFKDEPLVSSIEFAASIIERNGSELKIRQEENSVIFEFALPIVEE